MFIIPSTSIHRCLKHQGLLGTGKDFLTETPCLLHLYTYATKQKFGLQIFQNVTKEFVDNKIQQLGKTIVEKTVGNISRVVGFSKYSHGNKLIDFSVLYDMSAWYGMSLQNLITNRIKSNVAFKEQDILDFIWQMTQVLINTSTSTGEYLQLTPINIFAVHQQKNGYSFFPNNFGLSFEETKWYKPYFNPNDKIHKQRTLQNSISSILFVIGMISLQMCTLQQSSTIYSNNVIDQKTISKSLQSIKLTFSSSLFQLISKLCNLNQSQRISLNQVENHAIFKIKRIQNKEIKNGLFQGVLVNNTILNGCFETQHSKYIGTLNNNYNYDGYGVLTLKDKNIILKGQFENQQLKYGQYYFGTQYVMIGTKDKQGYITGFKLAFSGNKQFLYMSGIFNEKRDLVKGKIVHYNGKTIDIDLGNRFTISRLSNTSLIQLQ